MFKTLVTPLGATTEIEMLPEAGAVVDAVRIATKSWPPINVLHGIVNAPSVIVPTAVDAATVTAVPAGRVLPFRSCTLKVIPDVLPAVKLNVGPGGTNLMFAPPVDMTMRVDAPIARVFVVHVEVEVPVQVMPLNVPSPGSRIPL